MSEHAIFVFGAGGHGKVVADILRARSMPFRGFLDDSAARASAVIGGMPVLGGFEALRAFLAESRRVSIALAIGANPVRAALGTRLEELGIELLTLVHPSAVISPSATLGPGTVVMANASINADATIGKGAIVNTGAVIEHDVVLGDWSHVSPRGALGGGARLGHMSQLGIGGTVLPLVCVGDRTIVGAGAVVVRNAPDDVVLRGVPARIGRSLLST